MPTKKNISNKNSKNNNSKAIANNQPKQSNLNGSQGPQELNGMFERDYWIFANYLIFKILESKGLIKNNSIITPNLSFFHFAPISHVFKIRQSRYIANISQIRDHLLLKIPNIPQIISMSQIVLFFEKVLKKPNLIVNYSVQPNIDNLTFNGFILIPNSEKEKIYQMLGNKIKVDKNGFYLANNDEGITLLKMIDHEISSDENILGKYKIHDHDGFYSSAVARSELQFISPISLIDSANTNSAKARSGNNDDANTRPVTYYYSSKKNQKDYNHINQKTRDRNNKNYFPYEPM